MEEESVKRNVHQEDYSTGRNVQGGEEEGREGEAWQGIKTQAGARDSVCIGTSAPWARRSASVLGGAVIGADWRMDWAVLELGTGGLTLRLRFNLGGFVCMFAWAPEPAPEPGGNRPLSFPTGPTPDTAFKPLRPAMLLLLLSVVA